MKKSIFEKVKLLVTNYFIWMTTKFRLILWLLRFQADYT